MKTKFLAAIVAFLFVSCGGSSSDPNYLSNEYSNDSDYSNVSFRGESSDGYIYQGGNITLTRVISGGKDNFPHYKKGTAHYVKYGSVYIRVSGVGKFVSIGNIDYYAL